MALLDKSSIIAAYVRANLSPTKPEREMVSRRYLELQEILAGKTFQGGSYARFTSTTPVNDLDVFYELPKEIVGRAVLEARIDPYQLNMGDIVASLAQALRGPYAGTARIEEQPHSVGVYFGSKTEFSIDVVPAIAIAGGLYLVPASAHLSIPHRRALYLTKPGLSWIKSHPKGYSGQASALDARTGGDFRKVAKLVKKWRAGCKAANDGFPLKSFHTEIAVTEHMKSHPHAGCTDSVSAFFDGLHTLIERPHYPDLADAAMYIDAYVRELTPLARDSVLEEQKRVTPLLRQIDAATTEAQVIRAIEAILSVGTPAMSPGDNEGRPQVLVPAYSKPYRM